MIREGGIPGGNISILKAARVMGGSLGTNTGDILSQFLVEL
jgi:hypothetical protein